jgi:hypothetical protein
MHTKKYRASPLTDKKKSNSVRRQKKNIEQTENLPTPPSKIKWFFLVVTTFKLLFKLFFQGMWKEI